MNNRILAGRGCFFCRDPNPGFIQLVIRIKNIRFKAQIGQVILGFENGLNRNIEGPPNERRAAVSPQRHGRAAGGYSEQQQTEQDWETLFHVGTVR